ncbi:TonB-dependent receptor [Marinimicrobium koreense]|uniref:TonB-dependent receptor n=1 Tax=Marinimicrobium koreense TaxID=306545 RepID=A0A3N1P0Z1_9GAMM|nr:TonB-dependent receptor [Marinimicrobium koreense]ROQ21709.1 TonB-dependent receptor [Marinimicrobium koreense]
MTTKATNLSPKRLAQAIALGAASAGAAYPSLAQEEAVLEEIIVSGVRSSIEGAVDIKRRATNIVDGITAEDIGQMPDVSIADAISRIPGVNYTTNNGRAEFATIRGLTPDLTLTTFNGRILTTTAPGTRRVAMGRLPSELLNRVTVAKSPEAKMIEGGVAGTVQLETVKPLDRKRRSVVGVVRGLHNENADDIETADGMGWRGSLSYIDQLMDNKLGIALGWAGLDEDTPVYENRLSNPRFRAPNNGPFGNADENLTPRNDLDNSGLREVSPGAVSYDIVDQDVERNSFLAVVQYEPTADFSLNFDAAYVEQTTFVRNNRLIFENLLIPELGPSPGTEGDVSIKEFLSGSDDAFELLTAVSDGLGRIVNFRNPNNIDEETVNLGLKSEYRIGDWTLGANLSHSSSTQDRDNPTLATQMLSVDGRPGLPLTRNGAFDITDSGNIIIGFEEGVENPEQWGIRNILTFQSESEDEINSLSFDANWNVNTGFISSVDLGVRIEQRDLSLVTDRNRYFFGPPPTSGNWPTLDESDVAFDFPYSSYFNSYGDPSRDGSNGLDYTPYWPQWNEDALIQRAFDEFDRQDRPASYSFEDQLNSFDLPNTFDLSEDTAAFYAQLNFDSEVAGLNYFGNAGIRVVSTDVEASGFSVSLDNLTARFDDETQSYAFGGVSNDLLSNTESHSYTKVLPSLNLTFELTDNLYLRTAAARTMSRPLLTDLIPTVDTNVDANQAESLRLTPKSPDLDPFFADQADLSLEWYLSEDISMTAGYYFKKVEAFLTRELQNATTPAIEVDESGNPTGETLDVETLINRQVNADTSFDFQGLEFSYNHYFGMGFGVTANASFNDTDAVEDSTGVGTRIIPVPAGGISDEVYNVIPYYEQGPLAIRLAWNKNSGFSRPARGSFQETPDGRLDMTFQYEVNKHIKIIGSARNITDETLDQYTYLFEGVDPVSTGYPERIVSPGRSYTLGLRARF